MSEPKVKLKPVEPSPASNKSSAPVKTKLHFRAPSNPYGLSIFHYVFMLLFIVSFFYAVSGTEQNLTFSGLLSILENAPSIPTDWIGIFSDLTIKDNWGLFEFLRSFLNSIMGIISFGLYLVTGAAQLIVYIGYFIGMLFGY